MASGTTLANLRGMLLAEIGDYSTPNTTRTGELNTLLSNMQKLLASKYSWPFLEQYFEINVPSGTQYPSFPTTIDSGLNETIPLDRNRPWNAYVFWNNIYQSVEYGIDQTYYNWMNFALGQAMDPIQRWRFRANINEPVGSNTIEIWPVNVLPQTLRFVGQRSVQSLVQETDTCDLDDLLIVYFAAAKILKRMKQADAPDMAQLAMERLKEIRAGLPTQGRDIVLGQGEKYWRERRRLVPMIAVHG